MNEPLSEVIRIRVTSSHAARLGEAAVLSGLSLSNYIRRRLSADDTLQEELTLLRKVVADLDQLRDTRLAAVESAHLLRAMAKPEHLAIAQQTLQQRRYPRPPGRTLYPTPGDFLKHNPPALRAGALALACALVSAARRWIIIST